MMITDCKTETPGGWPQILTQRAHTFRTDVIEDSTDSAPGAHDYFDAALAACKALTATWFAKHHDIPLESVSSHVERDDSQERAGKYTLRVRVTFHGEKLTDEHRTRLAAAVAKCPIHKLMTTSEVIIETLA
jgi:putative redox protein